MSHLLVNAYEAARLENIQRNAQLLVSLGLQAPTQRQPSDASTKQSKPKPKRVKRTPAAPSRRSDRLKGVSAPIDPFPTPTPRAAYDDVGVEQASYDMGAMMALKIARLKELHKEKQTGYKNPTATYEHTWKRVKTMSDSALARRVNVIERALGQHCIVKMRMFAEVLILAGKHDLAKLAEESLQRLLAIVEGKTDVGRYIHDKAKKVVQSENEKVQHVDIENTKNENVQPVVEGDA